MTLMSFKYTRFSFFPFFCIFSWVDSHFGLVTDSSNRSSTSALIFVVLHVKCVTLMKLVWSLACTRQRTPLDIGQMCKRDEQNRDWEWKYSNIVKSRSQLVIHAILSADETVNVERNECMKCKGNRNNESSGLMRKWFCRVIVWFAARHRTTPLT